MNSFARKVQDKLGRSLQQARLINRDFTLFSNDCWGAEVYKYFELPYNTPFVGLMMMAPCYLKLLQQPQHYLSQPLQFVQESRYDTVKALLTDGAETFPIATLAGDVEIQFLHYHSEEEAVAKWTRRVGRINWNNVVVKLDGGKDYATPELLQSFEQLPYRKLLLLEAAKSVAPSAVVVPGYTTNGMLQFRRSLPVFDLAGWLNTGIPDIPSWQKLFHKLLYA